MAKGSLWFERDVEQIDTWDLTFRLTVTDDYQMLRIAAPTASTAVTETLVGQEVLENGRKRKGLILT
jgi:hypothetical protein